MTQMIRIGNASGFYGDRFSAVREMLEDGPLDVLTGDYLAELTMLILGRSKLKDPSRGYASTFLRQMEECMGLAVDRGVKIVVNAGGLNPAGLAAALRDLAVRLAPAAEIAHVEGDDLLDRAGELGLGRPLTANAYLGAFGIAQAVRAGADIVVTGRVTDASLVVGPAAARFGWGRGDYDALAGATAAGHILECGAQATGGNFAFFTELTDARHPGFPIAEIHEDGSAVITKHAGTGGAVTVETVTAQLLYEIGGPRYLGPDVTTRFDTIRLAEDGPGRVRVHGARGEAPPPEMKVCLNHLGGYRNEMTFVLTGLDIEEKAALVRSQLSLDGIDSVEWQLIRTDRADASSEQEASALLRCVVRDADSGKVGRAFSGAAVELALASYPGFNLTSPPGDARPYGVYEPAFVPQDAVAHTVVLHDGSRVDIPPPPPPRDHGIVQIPDGSRVTDLNDSMITGRGRLAPLGLIAGARSGDKGGDANVGVWARTERQWPWLAATLTADRFKELLPETGPLEVERHVFANLRALNFVVKGLLGQGVAASTRFDPQAKAVGEWLRAQHMDIPEELLP